MLNSIMYNVGGGLKEIEHSDVTVEIEEVATKRVNTLKVGFQIQASKVLIKIQVATHYQRRLN